MEKKDKKEKINIAAILFAQTILANTYLRED